MDPTEPSLTNNVLVRLTLVFGIFAVGLLALQASWGNDRRPIRSMGTRHENSQLPVLQRD
jgi:hypothetical protein